MTFLPLLKGATVELVTGSQIVAEGHVVTFCAVVSTDGSGCAVGFDFNISLSFRGSAGSYLIPSILWGFVHTTHTSYRDRRLQQYTKDIHCTCLPEFNLCECNNC